MRTLKNILFTCAMIVGLTVSMMAQKNDDQKKPRPPKPPPPVINPGEGKEKPRPPKEGKDGGKKPKKGNYSMVMWKEVDAS